MNHLSYRVKLAQALIELHDGQKRVVRTEDNFSRLWERYFIKKIEKIEGRQPQKRCFVCTKHNQKR